MQDDSKAEPVDAAAAAAAKAAAWAAVKQARFGGDSSAHTSSSSSNPSSSPSSSRAASSRSSSSAASASASSSDVKEKEKGGYQRPVAKPLPKIARSAARMLDASQLKPVTPDMLEERKDKEALFGKIEPEEEQSEGKEPGVKQEKVKQEVKKEHSADSPQAALAPLPTTGFGALGLSDRLLRALVEKMGLKYPTKIQKEGIPQLLGGADALVKSETGSGKTLTYLIPIVQRLVLLSPRLERNDGTMAIILAPTRELVLQIHGVLAALLEKGGFYWLVSGVIMGGEKKKSEKSRLRKGLHLLVATVGRLLDHLQHTECLNLRRLMFFCLDEADRLLDMGFEKDLSQIVELLDEKSKPIPAAPAIVDPRTGKAIVSARSLAKEKEKAGKRTRQNLLVSATLNAEIEKMASITLRDPILIGFKQHAPSSEDGPANGVVKLESGEGAALVNANKHLEAVNMPTGLVQQYLQVEHRHKLVALASLLRKKIVEAEVSGAHFKAVVFFSTCASVEFHHSLFKFSYWPYDRSAGGIDVVKSALLDSQLLKLHGNLTQQERTKTYQHFCQAAEGVLLCTDVAARGLDLPAVDYIFQYDAPEDTADYIHRVGRTARMGRKGQAVLFLMSSEMDYLDILKDKTISPEPLSFSHILQSLHTDSAKNRIYDDARGGSPAGAILHKQFEALVSAQPALKENAINAYHSYLRAYAAYPRLLKPIFHPRKLHIGHVARSFALQDAPTQLAKSEIVSKQRATDAREKQRDKADGAAPGLTKKKQLVSSKPIGPAASSIDAAAATDSISSGVRPAFGGRDRARNTAAQAKDAAMAGRKRKDKPELSNVGWKIGTEATGSSKAKKGIDRARSNKIAQAFKKKKVDLVSEFAA